MSLSSKHPLYDRAARRWTVVRDSYEGEDVVKEKGQVYLPATEGMEADGMGGTQPGRKRYDAYKARAVFHDLVRPAVEGLVGILNHKPAKIELPAALEPLRDKATSKGEGLDLLLRKIHEQQLLVARVGAMLDVQDGALADALPYIVTYHAETIYNWDEGRREDGRAHLRLAVLCETQPELQSNFVWQEVVKYRVLALKEIVDALGGSRDTIEGEQALGAHTYMAAEVRQREDVTGADFRPVSLAGKTLEELPFVFVGSKDHDPTPDVPPMLALARIALAMYRGEADYRQALFAVGQETLVIVGMQAEQELTADGEAQQNATRVGAGQKIELPLNGDAKYIGPESKALEEQREALQNDGKRADAAGAQLLQAGSGGQAQAESGDALSIRVAAKTATLTTIAKTGAEALERLLKIAATWVGANPDEVKVEPNLEFAKSSLSGQDATQWMTAKNAGYPISAETLHQLLVTNEISTMTFEEELDAISREAGSLGSFMPSPQSKQEKDDAAAVVAQQKAAGQGPGGLPPKAPPAKAPSGK